jgi:hypothetical protein
MKILFLTVFSLAVTTTAFTQDTTHVKNVISVSGYLEAYYNHDFNRPENNTLPGFMYNFNRANEVNLNLAFVQVTYGTDRVRANLGLGGGTYMNANYSAEPGVLKNIYQANIGVKLSRKHKLWMDAGIMPSHLGFESATGKDNWTLSRSLSAENSPYFESGLKLGFTTKDEKLYLSVMYLNGWQRIQKMDGNSNPGFGTQVTYKPTGALMLNYSTFIGNDKPDSLRQMRYFHNVYATIQLTSQFGLIAGIDFGAEQNAKLSNKYNHWYTPVLIARYSPHDKVRLAARAEYYVDQKGVIIRTGTANGFKTFGGSLNFDYLPFDNVMWRLEVRSLRSKDAIFNRGERARKDNYFLTTSMILSF